MESVANQSEMHDSTQFLEISAATVLANGLHEESGALRDLDSIEDEEAALQTSAQASYVPAPVSSQASGSATPLVSAQFISPAVSARPEVTPDSILGLYDHFLKNYHTASGHRHCKISEHLVKIQQPPKYQKKTFTAYELYLIVRTVNGFSNANSWCEIARRIGFDTKGTNIAARIKDWVTFHHFHSFCDYLLGIPNSFYMPDRIDLVPSQDDPIPARKRGRPPKALLPTQSAGPFPAKKIKYEEGYTETDIEMDLLAEGSPASRRVDYTSDEDDGIANYKNLIRQAENILIDPEVSKEEIMECVKNQHHAIRALKEKNDKLKHQNEIYKHQKARIISILSS